MSDILIDLKNWLAQLVKDKEHRKRQGEMPEIDIDVVSRAIVEIESLRAKRPKP